MAYRKYFTVTATSVVAAVGVACSAADAPGGREGQSAAIGAAEAPPLIEATALRVGERTRASVPIAIRTKASAECRIRPVPPADSSEGLVLYADDEGVLRFAALPELVAANAVRPVIDCKGEDGFSSTYTVDLQASVEVATTPASSTQAVRPMLAGDPMALTDDELFHRGYPHRPDPIRSPAAFALWRSIVSKPATIVSNKVVPISRRYTPTTSVGFSPNWAGGILRQASSVYAEVWGEWVVPDVSNSSQSNLNGNLLSSTWVGIGGWATPAGSQDLLQDGTEQDWQYPGFTNYFAWYEQLPAQAVQFVNFVVHANDTVVALAFASDASGNVSASAGYAGFQMENLTTGKASAPVVYKAPGAYPFFGGTVEWIEERPLNAANNLPPLANFGTVDILGFADDINGQARTDSTDDNLGVFMYSPSTGDWLADGFFENPGYPGAVGVVANFGTSE